MTRFFKIISFETEYPHWHDETAWVIKTEVEICGRMFVLDEILDDDDLWPNLPVLYNSDFSTYQLVRFLCENGGVSFYFKYDKIKNEHKLIISHHEDVKYNKDIEGIRIVSSDPPDYNHHYSRVYEDDIIYIGEIEEYYDFIFPLLQQYYNQIIHSGKVIFKDILEKESYLQQLKTAMKFFPSLKKYQGFVDLIRSIETEEFKEEKISINEDIIAHQLNNIVPIQYEIDSLSEDISYPYGLKLILTKKINDLGDHKIELCPFDLMLDFNYIKSHWRSIIRRRGPYGLMKNLDYNKEIKNNHFIRSYITDGIYYMPTLWIQHQFLLIDEEKMKLFYQEISLGQGITITSYVEFLFKILRRIYKEYFFEKHEDKFHVIKRSGFYVKQIDENIGILQSPKSDK